MGIKIPFQISLKCPIHIISLYVAFCIVGAGLELVYGKFWELIGNTPWIYPKSFFQYTSLEGIPLWGFGGLVCIAIYEAIMKRDISWLALAIPPLILAAIWVTICAYFITS